MRRRQDDAARIAWGGFYLEVGDDGWQVVDDNDLPADRTAGGTIGAQPGPYGTAFVEVLDEGGVAASATTATNNHV